MIYKRIHDISRMVKKKQARKYVTISILREYVNDVDFFMKHSPYGKLFSSKSDFIHRAVDAKLDEYADREVRTETHKLKGWYDRNFEKLQKRGINSWEDMLERALDYSERFQK